MSSASRLVVLLSSVLAFGPGLSAQRHRDLLEQAEQRLRAIYDRGEFRARRFRGEWLPDSSGYTVSERDDSGRTVLVKVDAATGKVLEIVDFAPGSADPHGLAMHNGSLISCDAGIHPNWPTGDSPTSGWIFRIDIA